MRLNVTAHMMNEAAVEIDEAAAWDTAQRNALIDLLRDDIDFYECCRGQRR